MPTQELSIGGSQSDALPTKKTEDPDGYRALFAKIKGEKQQERGGAPGVAPGGGTEDPDGSRLKSFLEIAPPPTLVQLKEGSRSGETLIHSRTLRPETAKIIGGTPSPRTGYTISYADCGCARQQNMRRRHGPREPAAAQGLPFLPEKKQA